jgi:tetratricopeptide (TPR) repeat protein
MRILFVDLPSNLTFNVATPEQRPLGGMASSACFLARALAARGHDVTLAAKLPDDTPAMLMGVRHIPMDGLLAHPTAFFRDGDYDAVIALNYPDIAPYVKGGSPRTFNVIWLHIYPDQPALKSLNAVQNALDAAVCVSATLQGAFSLSVPTVAIGNAISPSFENMFSSAADVLAAKQNRAVYASMPFRGLDQLVEVMDRVKGEVELDVFSSAETYQSTGTDYTAIFDAARRNPRIRLHGGVDQRTLAEAFRGAAFLTYPCTFIESSCIVAMEAMAAGLKVISNDLGALPETTMGFADLLPVNGGVILRVDHIAGITKLVEKNEAEFQRDPKAWAEDRFTQLQTINRECSWSRRAAQWDAFLAPAVAARSEGAGAKSKQPAAESVSLPPGLEEALFLRRTGNLAAAEQKCVEFLRLEPENATAHYFVGALLVQQGRFADAVASFDRASAIDPDHAEAHNDRGIALCNLGRLEEGVASFDKALAKKPNAADILGNRGMALMYLKRPQDALASFDAALAIQPANVQALMTRATILQDLGRPEEALSSYDKAVGLRPSPELHYSRAIVLADLSRFADALADLDRALALKQGFAEAWNSRGAVLQSLNRFEDAVASFDRAIALKPDLATARTDRENALRRVKRS